MDWILDHQKTVLIWLVAGSAVMVVGGLLLLPVVVTRIPEDYFVNDDPPRRRSSAVLHYFVVGGRNVLGWLLIAAGIAMLLLPGQGLLTILAGIMLVDFPGKRRLELAIIRRPMVLKAVNMLRLRFDHAPLKLPPPNRGESRRAAGDDQTPPSPDASAQRDSR